MTNFNLHFDSEMDLMDVNLLSLTIVSYSMVKRPELLYDLDSLLVNHLPKLLEPS